MTVMSLRRSFVGENRLKTRRKIAITKTCFGRKTKDTSQWKLRLMLRLLQNVTKYIRKHCEKYSTVHVQTSIYYLPSRRTCT